MQIRGSSGEEFEGLAEPDHVDLSGVWDGEVLWVSGVLVEYGGHLWD